VKPALQNRAINAYFQVVGGTLPGEARILSHRGQAAVYPEKHIRLREKGASHGVSVKFVVFIRLSGVEDNGVMFLPSGPSVKIPT
jgi:hypothetical protein